MEECCGNKSEALGALRKKQKNVLAIVLVLNAVMFGVELVAGLLANSVSLLADSLDMLGDSLVYGFSLYVVGRGTLWKVRAAISKAAIMGIFGLFVLGQVIFKIYFQQVPAYETMGGIGALALAVNTLCFALLWSYRSGDINMRSVWICSRNDLIANTSVLAAAALVWITASPWPDIAVGALICAVFLRSAYLVARDANSELRMHTGGSAVGDSASGQV